MSSGAVEGDDSSVAPSISAHGRPVAFDSFADNLVAGDSNFDFDVFVRDGVAGTTARASVGTDGTEGGLSLGSLNTSISADGTVPSPKPTSCRPTHRLPRRRVHPRPSRRRRSSTGRQVTTSHERRAALGTLAEPFASAKCRERPRRELCGQRSPIGRALRAIPRATTSEVISVALAADGAWSHRTLGTTVGMDA